MNNRELDVEGWESMIGEYLNALNEEDRKRVLRSLYLHPVMQAMVDIASYDPETEWRKKQTERYETFLFRDGPVQINRRPFLAKLKAQFRHDFKLDAAEKFYPEIAADFRERIDDRMEEVYQNLHWARRFDGRVPLWWWNTNSEHSLFRKTPDGPDINGIKYDFQVAGVLGLQLRPVLIDAAVSLEIVPDQSLDSEQIAMFIYLRRKETAFCISDGSNVFKLDENQKKERNINIETGFQEERSELISTQMAKGVERSTIDSGLQIYDELWSGTISPQNLKALRTRFVPEYLQIK